MPIPLILFGGGLAVSSGIALLRVKYKKRLKERKVVAAIIHENQANKKATFLSLIVTHRLLTRQNNQETKLHLMVSGAAIGVTAYARLFYPPLLWLGIPLILYNSTSIFNDALEGLLIKRKLRASVVDSIAIVGTLSVGCYFIAAFMNGLYFMGQSLLQKSRDQGDSLIRTRPGVIWRWQDELEIETNYESISVGDIVVVNAGETIPFDGVIIWGNARIDHHMLTGQAHADEMLVGDEIYAMTSVCTGKLRMRVEKTGGDTAAEQIYQALIRTTDYQATIEACSATVSDQLSWPTLVLSGVALGLYGPNPAIAVASSNFSSAPLLMAPIGVLNYQKLAGQQGITIKDGRSLELLSKVDTVVFDKSSLLSLKHYEIKKIHSWQALDENQVLRLAAASWQGKAHPFAQTLSQAASDARLKLPKAKLVSDLPQTMSGVSRTIKGKRVQVGSMHFMVEQAIAQPGAGGQLERDCQQRGNSLLYVSVDSEISGAIELQLSLRPEAKNTIRSLRKRGLNISLVSGDRRKPTRRIAEALYIDHYYDAMKPMEMASYVERLQAQGRKICFVGDGINTSIAMKKAQVSVSFQDAAAVARNTANIVMTDNSLEKLDGLIEFSDDCNKEMKANIAVSMLPAALGVVGIFLFRLNIYSSMAVYAGALGIGALNTVLPPFRTRKIIIMGNNYDSKDKKALSEQGDNLVRKFAFNSGLTGFIPIPGLDLVSLVGVQRTMIYRLCKLYDVPFSLKLTKALLNAMMGSLAWNVAAPIVSSALKLVPGTGTILGGASSAAIGSASTYASGKVFQKHFEHGGNLEDFDIEAAKKLFTKKLEEGKQLSHEKKAA